MKKMTLPILAALFAVSGMNAQEKNYNKWSIDLNVGANRAFHNWGPGYSAPYGFFHADAGVRYMFNDKFGLKADFGYDRLSNDEGANNFETNLTRYSLQGVVNLGRVLSFEDWTKTIGLLVHGGAGITQFDFGNFPDKDDTAINVMVGLTPQIRLGNRVALTLNITAINNFKQAYTWDGSDRPDSRLTASGSVTVGGETGDVNVSMKDPSTKFTKHLNPLLNTSIGFTFYLGGHEQHADWYLSEDALEGRVASLENRVTDIENKMLDSDGDGVPDYLDLEPNTPAGNMVDVKGRSIDKNKNGIPDSYEQYFADNYGKGETMTKGDSNTAKDLINDGYVAVYFDFDKSTPNNTEAVNFILSYLRSNPNANVTINGYADSVGNANYNERLSERRAKSVARILEQAGVSSSRITVNAKGEDASLDGTNKTVSKFARRVTFSVK